MRKLSYTAYFENAEDSEHAVSPYGGPGLWGYLDKSGNIKIPAKYIFVRPFREGLAAVETIDRRWIYIDYNGNEVMEGYPSDFLNGLACTGSNFIDKSGNIIVSIPEGYQVNFDTQNGFDNFHFGLIVVSKSQDNKSIYGVMDTNGRIVLESEDFEEVKIFKEKLVAVKIDDKWVVVNIYQ